MRTVDLGRLFEGATSVILGRMFRCWGYDVLETKPQASGSQHGFDLYFRLAKNHTALNVFVECKASKSLNTIEAGELVQKIGQLDWAGFPDKDVHLLFSPTRAVRFDNELLTLEDDSHPFVVIDWMGREGGGPALELFAAAAPEGEADLAEYRDYLLSEVAPGFQTDKTFPEVCESLKREFERRLAEHAARHGFGDYRIINSAFWTQVQRETHHEFLHYYYTKTDSTPTRLREVVANDFYVRNEAVDREFSRALGQAVKGRASLIKILSKGGEGKSTFLYHAARAHCGSHVVVWLEEARADILAGVAKQLRRLDTAAPLVFMLDNAALAEGSLAEFARRLTSGFRRYNVVLVVAEREFRYQHVEDVEGFEAVFNETFTINYRSARIRETVFERLVALLSGGETFPEEVVEDARRLFLADARQSLTERAFSVIKHLKLAERLKGYTFDWDDWDRFARAHAPKLERLYLVLAAFYQFGFGLRAEFCASLLKDVDFIDINSALRQNANLPIFRRGPYLFLRHETLAEWFLDGSDERKLINRRNSEEVFKAFLARVDTDAARDIFIWLCIKHHDFRHSYLARHVHDDLRASILRNFIDTHPAELKCRTELAKLHQRQRRWQEAEAVLLELKTIDPDNLHARTELSKIYQRQGRWGEAEAVLLELKTIEPDGLHARTELSKVYQRQRRWQEAEAVLLELKTIAPDNLHARTELSKVYQRQRRWGEAEAVLLECLRILPDDLNSRTELSKIYQRQGRWGEAEAVLLELKTIEPDGLHARTELSKVYQRQGRLDEAEELLLRCLEIDPNDQNSKLELGKICSTDPLRYAEADNLFGRILEVHPDNLFAKVELAALYKKMGRYPEREKILFEIYETNPEDIPTLMALARVFMRFRKYRVALRLLESALEVRDTDLLTLAELIMTHAALRDEEGVARYARKGEEILRRDPYNRHRERFSEVAMAAARPSTLVSLNEVGFCVRKEGEPCVEAAGVCYRLAEGATVNYKLREGDKVFFATYQRGGRVVADFVEPYFDSIERLDSLR